jgi:hypothetical protein
MLLAAFPSPNHRFRAPIYNAELLPHNAPIDATTYAVSDFMYHTFYHEQIHTLESLNADRVVFSVEKSEVVDLMGDIDPVVMCLSDIANIGSATILRHWTLLEILYGGMEKLTNWHANFYRTYYYLEREGVIACAEEEKPIWSVPTLERCWYNKTYLMITPNPYSGIEIERIGTFAKISIFSTLLYDRTSCTAVLIFGATIRSVLMHLDGRFESDAFEHQILRLPCWDCHELPDIVFDLVETIHKLFYETAEHPGDVSPISYVGPPSSVVRPGAIDLSQIRNLDLRGLQFAIMGAIFTANPTLPIRE